MTKAFIALTADKVEAGALVHLDGVLQQQTRLFHGGQCVCVLLVTFPPGSPEWEKWMRARTLDGMPVVRVNSIQSDAQPGSRA